MSCLIQFWDMKVEFLNKQAAKDYNQTMDITMKTIPEALVIRHNDKILFQNNKFLKLKNEIDIDEFIEDSDFKSSNENKQDQQQFIVKKRIVPWQGENAQLSLIIDNWKFLEGQKAKLEIALNKILLASVSHEYWTPLNAIKSCAENLKRHLDKHLNSETLKFIDIITVSVELMLSLIDDILDNAKIERNNFVIHNSEFSVQTLFEEVHQLFEIQAKGKGLQLSYQIHNENGEEIDNIIISSDRKRLKQILLNLLSNSLKFTDDGVIRFSCIPIENKLEFKVCDQGIGISHEVQKHLFKEFGLGVENLEWN